MCAVKVQLGGIIRSVTEDFRLVSWEKSLALRQCRALLPPSVISGIVIRCFNSVADTCD